MDSLQLLRAPWIFLQESPLTTRTLKDEARRRGIELDPATLRELYRQGYFSPLFELTARRQQADVKLDWPRGSRQQPSLQPVPKARYVIRWRGRTNSDFASMIAT